MTVPFLETQTDNSYLISAPMKESDDLIEKFTKITRQTNFERKIIAEFTPAAMAERIFNLLQVNYCYTKL